MSYRAMLAQEKLEALGAEALRNEELLSILLRLDVDKASEVLKQYPPQALVSMKLSELNMFSRGRRRVLIAAVEFTKRALNQGMGIEPSIAKPADAVGMLAEFKDRRREHFVVLFLNARNQVIKKEEVAIGTLNASLVHPREVFYGAIDSCAAGVILAHNHPSRDVTPSREDIELTRRMVEAGEIIGIEVLDHIVLGKDRFLSMKEAELF